MENIIPNKITNSRHLKELDITKSCLAIENNQLKCSDYSLLFSMHVDDMNNISTCSGLKKS